MSTSYYLACDKCQECYLVGQDGWKFFTFYSGEPSCMAGIRPFIEKHVLCGDPMRLLSEHRVEDYKEVEWPSDPNAACMPTQEGK
jgi:hypothetical protein